MARRSRTQNGSCAPSCQSDFGVAMYFCHGQRPVISTSSEKLKKVRMTTMPPSTATLVRVGLAATVRMMSPATRSSNPNKIVRPSSSRNRR